MEKIFTPSTIRLKFLLDSIHEQEIALPDFQRDFVWDPRATEELIESICQSFPAGSLLRIKNSAGFYFAPREFAGAPSLVGEPTYLILDGQQRLTSLYQAFYGVGDHRYYVNLRALMDGADLEDAVFHERVKVGEKRYGTMAKQAASLVFPLKVLFGDAGGFDQWLDEVLERQPHEEVTLKELKRNLRDLRKLWLLPIEDYEFPVVTLAEKTTADAVCTIFETLNRTGVKLSVFDLLAARFWPADIRLRDWWVQARESHPIIADFEIDPFYVLQAVSIYAADQAPSCKRGDVLKLSEEQIRRGWGPVVKGLADALSLLREDCGIVLPQWLPYAPMLITAAATLAAVSDAKGPEVAASKNRLKQWFWCAVFGQAYENSPNTQAVKDYAELLRWIRGGDAPESVSTFSFDTSTLRQVTPRQRALYRGVIGLILRHDALDFHNGKRVTAAMVQEEKIDDHHVFPQAHLAVSNPNVSKSLRDCILNRTLIDRITNIVVGKRAPSDYLVEIEKKAGASHLDQVLASHLLPYPRNSGLWTDDFEAFLDEREQLIAEQLKLVTQ